MNNPTLFSENIEQLIDSTDLRYLATLNDDLRIAETTHLSDDYPSYFTIDRPAVQYIKKGSFEFTANLNPLVVKAPAIIIHLPETVLSIKSKEDNCLLRLITYSSDFGEEMQANIYSHNFVVSLHQNPVIQLDEDSCKVVEKYFDLLQEVIENKNCKNKHATIISLMKSFQQFLQDLYSEQVINLASASRAEQITSNFQELVEQHCTKERSVSFYADQLHVSQKYLASVVKQTTNRTIGDWIDAYTLLQAKLLLLTSTYSIQEISHHLNFANQSHFGTWFRRLMGKGPREFRQSKH